MRRSVLSGVIVMFMLAPLAAPAWAIEKMTLGTESISPGITARFIAETRDKIEPSASNLSSSNTDIHLAALVNWAGLAPPEAVLRNQFVPYLNVSAVITDAASGKSERVELLPHLSAADGLQYGRNVKLPGMSKDHYTVIFTLDPPAAGVMNYHADWVNKHGADIFPAAAKFTYKGQDFEKIVNSQRPSDGG